ncbi:hypothetical protein HDU79_010011 [Rhizoclosmatium sp. JEL0117]|nr:hypothetical protein HDU79_010011 [Rhizoclosmatium sp. JEL0117]
MVFYDAQGYPKPARSRSSHSVYQETEASKESLRDDSYGRAPEKKKESSVWDSDWTWDKYWDQLDQKNQKMDGQVDSDQKRSGFASKNTDQESIWASVASAFKPSSSPDSQHSSKDSSMKSKKDSGSIFFTQQFDSDSVDGNNKDEDWGWWNKVAGQFADLKSVNGKELNVADSFNSFLGKDVFVSSRDGASATNQKSSEGVQDSKPSARASNVHESRRSDGATKEKSVWDSFNVNDFVASPKPSSSSKSVRDLPVQSANQQRPIFYEQQRQQQNKPEYNQQRQPERLQVRLVVADSDFVREPGSGRQRYPLREESRRKYESDGYVRAQRDEWDGGRPDYRSEEYESQPQRRYERGSSPGARPREFQREEYNERRPRDREQPKPRYRDESDEREYEKIRSASKDRARVTEKPKVVADRGEKKQKPQTKEETSAWDQYWDSTIASYTASGKSGSEGRERQGLWGAYDSVLQFVGDKLVSGNPRQQNYQQDSQEPVLSNSQRSKKSGWFSSNEKSIWDGYGVSAQNVNGGERKSGHEFHGLKDGPVFPETVKTTGWSLWGSTPVKTPIVGGKSNAAKKQSWFSKKEESVWDGAKSNGYAKGYGGNGGGLYHGLKDGPVFPEIARIGLTVQGFGNGLFWIIAFGLTVRGFYEIFYQLKKQGLLAVTVDKWERLTGLNLSWILILWDVDPTREYLEKQRRKQKVGDSRIEPLGVEDVVDASGHPYKGRSLYDDRLLRKTRVEDKLGYSGVPGPQGNQFNPMGWREKGGQQQSVKVTRSRQASAAPATPIGSAISAITQVFHASTPSQVDNIDSYDFRKQQQAKPLFNYTIKPRILYPTRGDPNYPYLSAVPAPIANVLDFTDSVWEAAVDTAAWGVGVVAVRPAKKVLKTVGKVGYEVKEWVDWTGRYSRQSFRRLLGYSKPQKIEVVNGKNVVCFGWIGIHNFSTLAYHLIVELYSSGTIILTGHDHVILAVLRVADVETNALSGASAPATTAAVADISTDAQRIEKKEAIVKKETEEKKEEGKM